MATANVPSIDNIATLPQPSHITLLLRHHKSATFLSIAPTQSFDSIKELLLAVLQARNISSLRNASDLTSPIPLPSSPDDLELGVLVDKKDASKGWTLIKPESASSNAAGKKKASSKSADTDTPAALGLSDGGWLAYRVAQHGARARREPSIDANGDVVVDVDLTEDPGWDVVLPTFDDDEEGVEEEAAEAGPS
jgi:hypothetical protein